MIAWLLVLFFFMVGDVRVKASGICCDVLPSCNVMSAIKRLGTVFLFALASAVALNMLF
jgi:hypothetical protein